jgi:hypothetical protein
VKSYTNSVKVQPQLSNDRHPMDGGCGFTVLGQLIVIEIILALNLGSKAERIPESFLEYSYGQMRCIP